MAKILISARIKKMIPVDMTLIIFDSKTNNVKRFTEKLHKQHAELIIKRVTDVEKLNEPFHLITYTTGMGEIPESTQAFLAKNAHNLLSVTTSGNMNWGERFGLAADKISALYHVPILFKFELSGTQSDINIYYKKLIEWQN